jgi:hypothetical protein
MQRCLVVVYRCFWTAYRSQLQGLSCPETSENNYQITLRKKPEERRHQLHSSENLKTLVDQFFILTTVQNWMGWECGTHEGGENAHNILK